jgi:Kef-type K+ transport system membrane component KefB
MMNLFLFLALLYLLTFVLGGLIRKIRIPWIFASLFIGFFASIYNPFTSVTSSETFSQFAHIGMYLLLFIVGFQLDLEKMKKTSGFIFRATFFIILFEAVFGILLIHYLFNVSWLISFVVALSFATVGEAVLVPILDEFKMINTKLGQSILGIGILDDLIEVFTLIIAVVMISSGTDSGFNTGLSILSISAIIIMTFLLFRFKGASHFLKDIKHQQSCV